MGARVHGLNFGRPVQGDVRCERYGKRRVPHRKCPELSDGFVGRRRSPSFGRQDWGGIAFLESWYSYCPDGYVPVDVTSSTWFCGSNGSLVTNAPSLYSVCQVLSCPSSVLLEDDVVEGLGCYSLTLGEAWVVTCADGYTAAGDTET